LIDVKDKIKKAKKPSMVTELKENTKGEELGCWGGG